MKEISLEKEEHFNGAIVIGTHMLAFGKGAGAEAVPNLERQYEFAGLKCWYTSESRTKQSFLRVGQGDDASEVMAPSGAERTTFELDMTEFTPDRFNGRAKITVDPGLMAMIAPTRWGKSTVLYGGLVPAMGAEPVTSINYLEVFEDSAGVPVIYTGIERKLLEQILLNILTPGGVLTIDSLRAFVYAKSVGGTGTAGLDQYFSVQLTALSNLHAVTGSLLVATINPMVDYDDEKGRKKYDEIVNQMVASTSFAFVGTASRQADLYPRGFSHPDRSTVSIKIKDLHKESSPKIDNVTITVVDNAKADVSAVSLARRLLTAASK